MDKRKYIIVGAVILLIIISFFMFKGEQQDKKDNIDGSLISNPGQNSENSLQEEATNYIAMGDSEKVTTKIDEYIPSMKSEEIQETLSKEISDKQRGTIEQALKDNEISFKTQSPEEIVYLDNSLASLQEAIKYSLNNMFNEFLTEANQGKYEYEKIGAMLATYASNLEQDIKDSNQFSKEELAVISASITEQLIELKNQLHPYLGSSNVKSEEELKKEGLIGEEDGEHPYQEIIDSTVEEAQQTEQDKQEQLLGTVEGSIVIPDVATEYKPPEVEYHSYDKEGNEVEISEAPPWAVPIN